MISNAKVERKSKLVTELLSLNNAVLQRVRLEKKQQRELEKKRQEEEVQRGREIGQKLLEGIPVKLREAATAGKKSVEVYKNGDLSRDCRRGVEEELARFCRREGLRLRAWKKFSSKYYLTISWSKKKPAPRRSYYGDYY